MTKKKIYIISVGMTKLFTESKEKAFKVFEDLADGDYFRLSERIMSDDYKESFSFPNKLEVSMHVETVDLFESEAEATRARDGYDKAKKMKLIAKKKP